MATSIQDFHNPTNMAELRRKLASLGLGPIDIKMFAQEAGLPTERIDFGGGSEMVWYHVLAESQRQGDAPLSRLLDIIKAAFPEKKELQDYLAFLGPMSGTNPTIGQKVHAAGTSSTPEQRKILYLASSPVDKARLQLDVEIRDVEDALRRAYARDVFQMKSRLAVRPRDLLVALQEVDPHIVHFSGHGAATEGIYLQDNNGKAQKVTSEALSSMFELTRQVECVVLNACLSQSQAKAISKHIPYVIGTTRAITDAAAIEFAVGFYTSLGNNRSIDEAFQWARVSVAMTTGQNSDVFKLYPER